MIITVLGASGRTGREIVKQALEAGHTINALVRRADAFEQQAGLDIIIGDVTKPADVAKASKDSAVVVSALGATGDDLMFSSVKAVIQANKSTKVKRFILMSTFVVQKDQLSAVMKFMASTPMAKVLKDKTASEDMLRASDLDWTIVYPTGLTNTEKGATVRVLDKTHKLGLRHKIARADVAAWILQEIEHKAFVKQQAVISQ